jgi:hypothetical protein
MMTGLTSPSPLRGGSENDLNEAKFVSRGGVLAASRGVIFASRAAATTPPGRFAATLPSRGREDSWS